jgi:hypothetical protein
MDLIRQDKMREKRKEYYDNIPKDFRRGWRKRAEEHEKLFDYDRFIREYILYKRARKKAKMAKELNS